MPLKVQGTGKAAKASEAKDVKAKSAAVVEAEAAVVPSTSENVGSMSDQLCFVAALGDPSQDDITYIDKGDGTKDKKVDPVIVGYRFTAKCDLEVPDVAPGDDLKKNLMSYAPDADLSKTRTVKAGETFDLTKFETGALISREEFNARALGGEIQVGCSYANVNKKDSSGAIATVTAATALPSIALRAIGSGTSIKDVAIIPVLKYTTEKDPNTNVTRKIRTIIPGFEKWSPLCKVQTARRSGGAGSSANSANVRNKNAQTFLNIMAAKKAN